MNWKIKYYQNDVSKHIELWHSIFDELGNHVIYYILPQYRSKDWWTMDTSSPPELYLVFFGSARECTPQERGLLSYKTDNIDGNLIEVARFFRAFQSIDEAKAYCEELRMKNRETMEFVKNSSKKKGKK